MKLSKAKLQAIIKEELFYREFFKGSSIAETKKVISEEGEPYMPPNPKIIQMAEEISDDLDEKELQDLIGLLHGKLPEEG